MATDKGIAQLIGSDFGISDDILRPAIKRLSYDSVANLPDRSSVNDAFIEVRLG